MNTHLRPPLRLLTCGSVDDGKSTLIGRLLHDTGNIAEDQRAGLIGPDGEVDYSRLVDGLEAEREQGITIDVAYRAMQTAARRFIIADTPGHEQFTRNMATAAADADLAILLVDARKGLRDQTRRHAGIAAVMGVRHVVLAVNKMDLVDYSAEVFAAIVDDFAVHAQRLGFAEVQAIPLAAKPGATIATRAAELAWYQGPTLLDYLEGVDVARHALAGFRLPVQRVSRVGDFRGFAGTVRGGLIAVGDTVAVLPGGRTTTIERIVTFDGDLPEAGPDEAVTLVLADEIEAARGSIIADPARLPVMAERTTARLVWFGEHKAVLGRPLLLRTPTDLVPARLSKILGRLDLATLIEGAAESLSVNDLGTVEVRLERPVPLDAYGENRATGAFLLIDRATNETLAAGMALAPEGQAEVTPASFVLDRQHRARLKGQSPAIVWLTGLSGSGKSTLAGLAEAAIALRGQHCYVLDGDNVRSGLNRDLGFSTDDRTENVRRLGEVAKLMADAGLIVFVAAISPRQSDRDEARRIAGDLPFFEVFIDTPLEICEARDPKGLYAKARSGAVRNFTGVSAGYERPEAADLILTAGIEAPEALVEKLVAKLAEAGVV